MLREIAIQALQLGFLGQSEATIGPEKVRLPTCEQLWITRLVFFRWVGDRFTLSW